IGGIGSIKSPIILEVENGIAYNAHSDDEKLQQKVYALLDRDQYSSICGEFAISINKKARVNSEFLEAEKAFGTAHIAFGNNMSFPGGQNPSISHVDFLISEPTVVVTTSTHQEITLMKNGKFI
ncbi:MAG: aminopeptidase, partial [Candidatus Odinarchaeia archaeon]